MEKKVELPSFRREARVAAGSFNEDDNTIDIVWTTGATVRRYDWWDGTEYDEVLSLEPGAVRLDRLNAGAPFLDTHQSYTLANVIGSVVPGSARIEGGKGVATVRLSRAEVDAATVSKIRDSIIRNISVGYWTHKIIKTESDGEKVARWDVVDWEPLEISAVPINADAGSQIRSETSEHGDKQTRSCTLVTKDAATAPTQKSLKGKRMPSNIKRTEVTAEAEAEKKRLAALRAAKRDDDKKKDDEDAAADEESDADTENTGTEVDPDEMDSADDADSDDEDEDGDKKRSVGNTPKEIREAAVKAERQRSNEIFDLAARAGLPKFGRKHINAGTSVRKFRDLMFDRMLEKQNSRGAATVGAAPVAELEVVPSARAKGPASEQRDIEAGAAMAKRALSKA